MKTAILFIWILTSDNSSMTSQQVPADQCEHLAAQARVRQTYGFNDTDAGYDKVKAKCLYQKEDAKQ